MDDYYERRRRRGREYDRKARRREEMSVYKQQKLLRIAKNGNGPSLPAVSILETPTDLTPADYYAGKAALSAAGLS